MKKTLERLKAKANRNLKEYVKVIKEIQDAKDDFERRAKEGTFFVHASFLVNSLIDYIAALKDYLSELDEHWDKKEEDEMKKLIELIHKTGEQKQPKPVRNKEDTKKTPYIK